MTRTVQWTEAIYVALLPFLGAWAAMELESDYVPWIVAGGWLLATMNVYIYVPLVLSGFGRNWVLMMVPFVRITVLILKQGVSDGSLWAFFLDEALVETGSLLQVSRRLRSYCLPVYLVTNYLYLACMQPKTWGA